MAGKRRKVWTPAKEAVSKSTPKMTGTRRIADVPVVLPLRPATTKTGRRIASVDIPEVVVPVHVPDNRPEREQKWQKDFWERDLRDPPESYFDGSSPTGIVRPDGWTCKYGCPGVQVLGGTRVPHHAWNCPWWNKEGKDKTPF